MRSAFQLSSDFVDDACALDPLLCTQLGVPGSDDKWGDSFSVDGLERSLELEQRYLRLVEPFLHSEDRREQLAARVMVGSFRERQAAYEAQDHFRDLRHMASPFHQIRLTFDVMKTDSAEARSNLVRRLGTVADPLRDYRERLQMGLDSNIVVSARQVRSVIDQAYRLSREPTSIDEIVERVALAEEGVSEDLTEAATAARSAFGEFAEWLESRYLPEAADNDGVGSEPYARAADRLVGMSIDPDEAYAWGWEEFKRLLAEQGRVADLIIPGAGVEETKEFLETDPTVTAAGTDELLRFVEDTLGQAVSDLSESHFSVPDEIKPLTVQLAPAGSPLGVYYRRPSEDFSRPGGVWYSIGDQKRFPLYQHVSTAYHEGFPGHHLQIATAMSLRDQLSRFQRLLTWCPGYGEGWGMYAEVLMGELGYLENPQHYFGMLAKQMYRAARVVVDIGLHLGKQIDPGSPLFGREPWSFQRAVEFMRIYGFRTPEQARDEVLRYLGWPGQAIAYKIGEREILEIRSSAQRSGGASFDLRQFHETVVGNGTMRLDLLREVVDEQLAN